MEALLRKRLGSKPPASYSFAASEALRLCHYRLDRAQVRCWAMQNHLAHPKPNHRPTAPVKRWQRSHIGELWRLDATPHAWFPNCSQLFPMLNMLDDCSRVFAGSKIYEREILLAYLDFLPAAFIEYGLPAYFASENISDIEQANLHIQNLRLHRNQHEVHRELKMKPQQAWSLALKERRHSVRSSLCA